GAGDLKARGNFERFFGKELRGLAESFDHMAESLEQREAETRTAQRALAESEELFRATFDQSPIGACIVSFDYRFIRVNREICRFTGYTEEEILKLNVMDITYPEDLEVHMAYGLSLAQGTIDRFQMDKRYVRGNGDVVWGRLTCQIVKDGSGIPLYYLSTLEDIHERKLAEAALKKSEEKFNRVFHATPDLISLTSLDEGRYLEINDAYTSILGYTREEVIGKTSVEIGLYTEEERKILTDMLREKGRIYNAEFKVRHKSGEPITLLVASDIIELDGRRFLIAIARDITDRKKMEEALRENEERFRKIFEEGPFGMAIIDPDSRILKANDMLCHMLAYSEPELVGRLLCSLSHPDEAGRDAEYIDRLFQGSIPHHKAERRYVTGNGDTLWINKTVSVIRSSEGTPLYALAMIEDITEGQRIREQREALILELQDAIANIKTLRGLLPICAWCKKIRDDSGYWNQLELYISRHSEADFTHGVCPECAQKVLSEMNQSPKST
ncbi:MAG: PAS domain S-box protein, partial [Acidobacteriota bacterium]